jgi:hypothetical protein
MDAKFTHSEFSNSAESESRLMNSHVPFRQLQPKTITPKKRYPNEKGLEFIMEKCETSRGCSAQPDCLEGRLTLCCCLPAGDWEIKNVRRDRREASGRAAAKREENNKGKSSKHLAGGRSLGAPSRD